MTDFPDLKIKALVNFPANATGGAGIDIETVNGNFVVDLDYADFAPPVGGISDPAHQTVLLWNSVTQQYALTPVSLFGGGGGTPGTANPLMDGTAAPGTATPYSREDHVHPSDTSRAPLASPTFTGAPAAPTVSPGTDSTTRIATTAFVQSAVAAAGGAAPSGANPIMDGTAAPGSSALYSRGDHVHPSDTTKAPLASPAFTGVPAAPTAATATNTTQIATTAFVAAAISAGGASPSNANPAMDGTVAPGTSLLFSRGDHVHPTDSSRAAVSALPVPAAATPIVESGTGAVGTSARYAREDHVHPSGPGGTGGAAVLVSDNPPVGAADNSLWFESDTGNTYIKYNDGNSSQWVIVAGGGTVNAVTFTPQTLTTDSGTVMGQRSQARSNIYAAPFDALAYNGMQINGGMEVSQENGTSQIAVPSASNTYIVDGWRVQSGGAQTAYGMQVVPSMGLPKALQVQINPANPSPATGNFCAIYQLIEGYRIGRLMWGTAGASPITIAFWVLAVRPGTYSGSVRNGPGVTRSYAFSFTINAASTWEYKTVTIPGDTAGTWVNDNTAGMLITFALMAGSAVTTSANTWTAGNFYGVTGTINGVAATSDLFQITGVIILPGVEAPSAARSPLIMRPYDQELLTCQRYYEAGQQFLQCPAASIMLVSRSLKRVMRAIPTTTITAVYQASSATMAVNSSFMDSINFQLTATAASGYSQVGYAADARL